MINYKKHEILKQLSISTYRGNKNTLKNWEEVKTISNYSTGFRAKIYKNSSDVVISYCGTDSIQDLVNVDTDMLRKYVPVQTVMHEKYIEK